jgi:hypothetical protein
MKTFLKLKCQSLRAEIKLIGRENRRWLKKCNKDGSIHPMYNQLQKHAMELCNELRGAQLAYLFLRDREWPRSYVPVVGDAEHPVWGRIEYNVQKFAGGYRRKRTLLHPFDGEVVKVDQQEAMRGFTQWLEEAKRLDSKQACLERRALQSDRGHKRRQAYRDKYSQAGARKMLKQKWVSEQSSVEIVPHG